MKTTFKFRIAIAASVLCLNIGFGQKMKMTSDGSFDNKEFRDLIQFSEMDYFKVLISAENLKGKNYYILSKEIWKGKLKKTDTVFNSRQHEIFKVAADTLRFTVLSGKTDAKNIRVRFDFGRFSVVKNYRSTKSNEYSLRNFGTQLEPSVGNPFYAFACILPNEHEDGSKSWCEVDAAGSDIENWGKKFGIEHYLLFEMRFD